MYCENGAKWMNCARARGAASDSGPRRSGEKPCTVGRADHASHFYMIFSRSGPRAAGTTLARAVTCYCRHEPTCAQQERLRNGRSAAGTLLPLHQATPCRFSFDTLAKGHAHLAWQVWSCCSLQQAACRLGPVHTMPISALVLRARMGGWCPNARRPR